MSQPNRLTLPALIVAASIAIGGAGYFMLQLADDEDPLGALATNIERAAAGQEAADRFGIAADLTAMPLLPPPPPEAAAEAEPVSIARLHGISRMPGRSAALISVDGKPAAWVSVGASAHGVTVVTVERSRAVVQLGGAEKTLSLYDGNVVEAAILPSASSALQGADKAEASAALPHGGADEASKP